MTWDFCNTMQKANKLLNSIWNTLGLDQVWSILHTLELLPLDLPAMWKVKGEQLQCRQNGSNLIYSKLTILLLTVPLSLVWSDCSNMCTDCSTHRGGSNSTSLHAESSIALFSVVVCVDWGLADRNLLRITSESANNLQIQRYTLEIQNNLM